MAIEVEQKFPVSALEAVCGKLAALGGKVGQRREEVDRYYAHPARDFARTDEALRIRGVGPAAFLTYKGPKMDATTKTRREIELALPEGDEGRRAWGELLEALGFRPIGEVRKRRRKARVPWQGRPVEVSLDEVDGADYGPPDPVSLRKRDEPGPLPLSPEPGGIGGGLPTLDPVAVDGVVGEDPLSFPHEVEQPSRTVPVGEVGADLFSGDVMRRGGGDLLSSVSPYHDVAIGLAGVDSKLVA